MEKYDKYKLFNKIYKSNKFGKYYRILYYKNNNNKLYLIIYLKLKKKVNVNKKLVSS